MDEWPLYALDRATFDKSIANYFVQMTIGTLACGCNRDMTLLLGLDSLQSGDQ